MHPLRSSEPSLRDVVRHCFVVRSVSCSSRSHGHYLDAAFYHGVWNFWRLATASGVATVAPESTRGVTKGECRHMQKWGSK